MAPYWEPGTAYTYGDIVVFEDVEYKIIQPHNSQSDWTPPATPALWGRYYASHKIPLQEPGWQPHPDQSVEVTHEEQKKKWFDLDDKRKKELEIGGGLLAGLGVIGAGYYAYHEHQKNEEEKKAQAWAAQGWLRDAKANTDQYQSSGQTTRVTWVLNQGTTIPDSAIVGGQEEDGNTLYISRAYQAGGLHLGKASTHLREGASIAFNHKEIDIDTYEVLIGPADAVRWVQTSGKVDLDFLGAKPVEGGHEADGTPLFIVQAPHRGGVHPGKTSLKLAGALIPYGGSEVHINEYAVLVYA